MPKIKPRRLAGVTPTTPAATSGKTVVKKKVIVKAPVAVHAPGELAKINQTRRKESLSEEQKRWDGLQWEQFLDDYACTPSDEMSPGERNQVNYGRAFMRDERELRRAKALAAAKAAEEAPKANKSPEVNKMNAAIARTSQFIDSVKSKEPQTLEDKIRAIAEQKNIAAIRKDYPTDKIPEIPLDGPLVEIPIIEPFTVEETEMFEANPLKRMWEVAEDLARKGNEEAWRTLGFQMRIMINYCAEQIKDTGEVVYLYDLKEVFWPKPKVTDTSQVANERREAMRARVLAFLGKKKSEAAPGFDLKSKSYRVTLGAVQLAESLEYYVGNYKPGAYPVFESDEVLAKKVGQAAVNYYYGYLPIEKAEIMPEAEATFPDLDPDYISYLRIIDKYGLKVGEFLHQIDVIAIQQEDAHDEQVF